MHEFRRDEERTARAYRTKFFRDEKKRSHFNNTGHVFLFGKDMEEQWERVYVETGGKCHTCAKVRTREGLDADHAGKTPKTRCDCFHLTLNDGVTICNGFRLRCTMNPNKSGFRPNSCHAQKHGREIRSDRKERRELR